jgi:hypothetical protein
MILSTGNGSTETITLTRREMTRRKRTTTAKMATVVTLIAARNSCAGDCSLSTRLSLMSFPSAPS